MSNHTLQTQLTESKNETTDKNTTDVTTTHSDTLTCPYCGNDYLRFNWLGIGSPNSPCQHLIGYDANFHSKIRVSEQQLKTVDHNHHRQNADHHISYDQITTAVAGSCTVVHNTEAICPEQTWTAVYHKSPISVCGQLQTLLKSEFEDSNL